MNITIIFIKDEMNTEAKKVEFVPLLDFEDDYEILNEYPFTIRRKSDHYEVSEFINHYGYPTVALCGDNKLKHRLIALQFIPNDDPEHKKEVDHKNKDRTDYHLENLRWCTHSDNNINKVSYGNYLYEYVDELPEDAIKVLEYGKHEFVDYYFADDLFYLYTGINYRIIRMVEDKDGYKCVNLKNTQNKHVRVYYNKFKRLYDLI